MNKRLNLICFQITFKHIVNVQTVLIRGDKSDGSFVTKVAIQATVNGFDWLYVNPNGLDRSDMFVFRGNQDAETVEKVS